MHPLTMKSVDYDAIILMKLSRQRVCDGGFVALGKYAGGTYLNYIFNNDLGDMIQRWLVSTSFRLFVRF